MKSRHILALREDSGIRFLEARLAFVSAQVHGEGVAGRASLDVFGFLDYRAYLRAYYELPRQRPLSYRAFSRRAKLRSPNYLKLVIAGERNLSLEMAARFAEACGLTGDAAKYFCELVKFNQADGIDEQKSCYRRLLGFRRYRKIQKLDVAQEAYHSQWYLPAIRELAARRDFRADPDWIAAELEPPIKVVEAKQALDVLLELGLLIADEAGRLVQSTNLLTTGPETRSLHFATYHETMMTRAVHAMHALPAEDRDISSLTVCMAEDALPRLKQAVQRFRREILELSDLDENPVRVIQLNFQIFPLSRATGSRGWHEQ